MQYLSACRDDVIAASALASPLPPFWQVLRIQVKKHKRRILEFTENHPELTYLECTTFSTKQNKVPRWKLNFLYSNKISLLEQFVKIANLKIRWLRCWFFLLFKKKERALKERFLSWIPQGALCTADAQEWMLLNDPLRIIYLQGTLEVLSTSNTCLIHTVSKLNDIVYLKYTTMKKNTGGSFRVINKM